MSYWVKRVKYAFGVSFLIVDDNNKIKASCNDEDFKTKKEICKKYNPLNYGFGYLDLIS